MTNMIPAARLHGPRDLRVDDVSHPGEPPPGQVLLASRWSASAVRTCTRIATRGSVTASWLGH